MPSSRDLPNSGIKPLDLIGLKDFALVTLALYLWGEKNLI